MELDINKFVTKSKGNIYFNDKKFDQYFFHGIDNRQDLLKGIMFYTNRDANKENVDLHVKGIFPTKEENLEKLRKKLQEKFIHLYRFVYMLDRVDNRFDYHLSHEEEKKINQMVDEVIQQQIDDDMLRFIKSGIFFYDRYDEKREEKRKKEGKKGKGYINLQEHIWTREVYEVIRDLERMEELDKYQYYKRWVQAKIARLKETKQYPEERIKKLEEIYKIHEKVFDTQRVSDIKIPSRFIEQKDTGREL